MSLPPTAADHGLSSTDAPAVFATLRDELLELVEASCFWAAIVLPFLHVPLLLSGMETPAATEAFVALLALNVVAIVVGHRHRRD